MTLKKKKKIKIPWEWKVVFWGYGYIFYFKNNNGQLKAVLYENGVKDSNKEVFKLIVRQFKTKCSSKFIKFRYNFTSLSKYFSSNLFIGRPDADCKCMLKSKQIEIIKNSKNLKTAQIYNNFFLPPDKFINQFK